MDTTRGYIDLLFTHGCITEILDFTSGLPRKITIPTNNSEYVRVFVNPTVYSWGVMWKILQENEFITVSEIIRAKSGEILDKFGREKSYVNLGGGTTMIGWPDTEVWYDRDFVIRKG